MRLVFAGTPGFAATALRALAAAGHEIALVLTRPDRAAGRGMKLRPSDVKVVAQSMNLPVAQPATLRSADALSLLRDAAAPVMVVAAYGLILPQSVLDAFALGCLNIHASLLPRWRGAAPIQRAILAGDDQTGITIMRMDAGLDTGPVFSSRSIPIASDDTSASLHDKLASLGGQCIVDCIAAVERGEATYTAQPTEGIAYAHKIEKSEADIDWNKPALELEREIRAFNPFPVARTVLRSEPIRIWRAIPDSRSGSPGQILGALRDGIVVGCGSGSLRLIELQRASSKRLSAAEFLLGHPVQTNDYFGT